MTILMKEQKKLCDVDTKIMDTNTHISNYDEASNFMVVHHIVCSIVCSGIHHWAEYSAYIVQFRPVQQEHFDIYRSL